MRAGRPSSAIGLDSYVLQSKHALDRGGTLVASHPVPRRHPHAVDLGQLSTVLPVCS